MAEKKQQSGAFQNSWLNPAPTQINPQTGPYEMGGYQTDAFGRRYPTPGMDRVGRGVRGQPFANVTQHYGHTGRQHDAVQPPQMSQTNYDENIPGQHSQGSQGMLNYAEEMTPFPTNVGIERAENEYEKPRTASKALADYRFVGPKNPKSQQLQWATENPPKNPWASELEGAHPELLKQTHDFYETPQAEITMGERASHAGIQGADALGKGVRGGLGYGKNLLNAALYGKDSDQDFLQQGGKALGKGANFMQKLLFGSKPAPADPMQQSGTTPETDAMYQQGMEDNPWLNQEGDSQAATDAWWGNQEYGQKVGGASGSPFLSTIGGALSGGRDILKKGADWWWGDEMRGR